MYGEHLYVSIDDTRHVGEANKCFYCKEPLGFMHKDSCVARTCLKLISFTVDLVVPAPISFTDDHIRFHYTESSFCQGNLREWIDSVARRRNGVGTCWCGLFGVTGVRDATPDEARLLTIYEGEE